MENVTLPIEMVLGIRNYLATRPYAEVAAVMPQLDAALQRPPQPEPTTEPQGDPTVLGDRQRVRAMSWHQKLLSKEA